MKTNAYGFITGTSVIEKRWFVPPWCPIRLSRGSARSREMASKRVAVGPCQSVLISPTTCELFKVRSIRPNASTKVAAVRFGDAEVEVIPRRAAFGYLQRASSSISFQSN